LICGIAAPGPALLLPIHIEGEEEGKEWGRLRSEKLLEGDQIAGGEEKNNAEFAESAEGAEKRRPGV